MALYTNTRVRGIDIKLILNSGSADSIIMKQLIDQLGCQVDYATTAWIITTDGNTKTPIREINNFPFKINRIQIPIKKEAIHNGCMYRGQRRMAHCYQILLQTLCTEKIWTTEMTRQMRQHAMPYMW
ncbi:hypothetical protein G9A89_016110 [Geosiphon pyriformis]|nr:hypothetical protein G9A89_016110 [Geosiphon pyriformis]